MRSIDGNTKLVGLIGQPVSHSLSPVMHNAAFEKMNRNWVYLGMECSKNNLEIVLTGLKLAGFIGLNITIPHKSEVLKFCTKLTPIAKRLNAVNTLIADEGKGWKGSNTDVEGFIAPLKERQFEKNIAVVIGNGGSARAVVAGLQMLKIKEIYVIGRNSKSLKLFIQELDQESSDSSLYGLLYNHQDISEKIKLANLIINATPIGMKGLEQHNRVDVPLEKYIWNSLSERNILYDLIYTPNPTNWLRLGESKGCQTINGLEMLIEQGAASLRLWSNTNDVPIDTMRKAAKNALMN